MVKEIFIDGKLVNTMIIDVSNKPSERNKSIKLQKQKKMKNIYVKFWSPAEVGLPVDASEADIKEYCFRAVKYPNEGLALMAYANTMCTYSTLLEEDADVDKFINEAYEHYVKDDVDWLEANFT